jgi:hypothetical protein
MRKLVSGLVAAALLLTPSLALADAAGSAAGVKPSASSALDGKTRTLVVGSDIFIGDKVKTGSSGQVQILFADRTKLVIGPGSSLAIKDYLIRNNGDPGKFVIDVLSGTFRFATGDAPKNKYVINTPTGTIGVRGTRFDLNITQKRTWGIMFEGTTRDCSRSGDCVNVGGECSLFEIVSGNAQVVGDTREMSGAMRRELRTNFRYAVAGGQASLLRPFRFGNATQCLNPPTVTAPDSPFIITIPPPDQRGDGDGNGSPPPPIIY